MKKKEQNTRSSTKNLTSRLSGSIVLSARLIDSHLREKAVMALSLSPITDALSAPLLLIIAERCFKSIFAIVTGGVVVD